MRTFTHESNLVTDECINVDVAGLFNDFIFDGVFACEGEYGKSLGGTTGVHYSIDLEDHEVFDKDLFRHYLLSNQLIQGAIQKLTDIELTQDELDTIADIIEREDSDLDEETEQLITDNFILINSDQGFTDWDVQNLLANVASELGFKAVETNDEYGSSYIILPGNTLNKRQ